ncbi:hypothetical protein [Actinacidiphila acididurans]|uniref:Uncharacterized protein n=1 Tax=Actinacidiphila acididurans TaxID=2784346 RepID=A0ABS2TZR1_9ACTN|nr:hypothetical protein [Actinacidiphila acididurans]MBM9508441.1 hypothetical protein [Actinacidiphila acididurans]
MVSLIRDMPPPGGSPQPRQDAMVVIHRVPGDGGEAGWISGDHYCLGYYRKALKEVLCGTYRLSAGSSVHALYPLSTVDNFSPRPRGTKPPFWVAVAVVGHPGPFRLVGDPHHRIDLHQARAALEFDRPVTFLAWSIAADMGREQPLICDAHEIHCLDIDGTLTP